MQPLNPMCVLTRMSALSFRRAALRCEYHPSGVATVQVSLDGPSKAVVESRLDEIAQGAGVDRHPLSATATFTAGGPLATYGMTTSLHGPTLKDAELRTQLEPFEDEDVDPAVGVRFVVSPPSAGTLV